MNYQHLFINYSRNYLSFISACVKGLIYHCYRVRFDDELIGTENAQVRYLDGQITERH